MVKRLHQLSAHEIVKWREERQKAGEGKYSDTHLQRYGAVDITEELLDAENIAEKLADRCQNARVDIREWMEFEYVLKHIEAACQWLIKLDENLPDRVCTDEKGGYRPGWSELEGDNNV
jgi:hypothetical protein